MGWIEIPQNYAQNVLISNQIDSLGHSVVGYEYGLQ